MPNKNVFWPDRTYATAPRRLRESCYALIVLVTCHLKKKMHVCISSSVTSDFVEKQMPWLAFQSNLTGTIKHLSIRNPDKQVCCH